MYALYECLRQFINLERFFPFIMGKMELILLNYNKHVDNFASQYYKKQTNKTASVKNTDLVLKHISLIMIEKVYH